MACNGRSRGCSGGDDFRPCCTKNAGFLGCGCLRMDTREGCFTARSWIDRRGYCRGNTRGFERNFGLTALQIQTRWKEQWPGNLKSQKCCHGDGTRLNVMPCSLWKVCLHNAKFLMSAVTRLRLMHKR